MSTTLPPLSAYLHVPWCVRKCPYCDFNSHQAGSGKVEDPVRLPEEDYLYAMAEDLSNELSSTANRPLQSIFFGGGTPSLLQPVVIENLIDLLAHHVGLASDCEITMEANPGTFESKKFRDYRLAGVNRLSIGIQSFDELKLQALGRIHSSDEAVRAVDIARQAGFENLNLDLMFGLPGQTADEACRDLQQAIQLQPDHLSWYELTLEPNTEFYKKPPALPHEGQMKQINEAGLALLEQSGYRRYETSAFAKPGKQCRHNLNYWLFGDYLGLGPGAHGKVTDPIDNEITRYSKSRLPRHYLESGGTRRVNQQTVAKKEVGFEFLMNALRLMDGFELELMQSRTGLNEPEIRQLLQPLINKKFLKETNGCHIGPTELGVTYLNDCLVELMPD